MYWPLVGSRTVLVGCIAVIVAFEVVAGRRSCNTARYGLQRGREVHIQDQHLSTNNPDWRITVPPICNRIVGVSVTACDVDGAPSVYLSSLTHGMVMRTGRFSSGAFLYVTVFCDPEEVFYEENLPRPPPRFNRPPKPNINRWNDYQKPLAPEDIIIMSPQPSWPQVTTEYTTTWQEEPVVLGINSYSLPESVPISNSYPVANFNPLSQAYRSKDTDNDTTTESPQNVTESNNSTEVEVTTIPEVQPERSRTSVEELKPESQDTWVPQEVEPAREGEEPVSTDSPDKTPKPLSFLSHLARWWLKNVRSWAGLRARRRMWRRRGSRDNRRMFRRRYHLMSNIPRYS